MKILFSAYLILFISCTFAQSKDEQKIRHTLNEQTIAWNNGDLQKFMQGYWNSDSLMFIGKSGITYGWQKTLDNYKKGYPDAATMGKLGFAILHVKRLSVLYFSVVGKWHLARVTGDVSGYFTLIFKKIKNTWMIISDHSS